MMMGADDQEGLELQQTLRQYNYPINDYHANSDQQFLQHGALPRATSSQATSSGSAGNNTRGGVFEKFNSRNGDNSPVLDDFGEIQPNNQPGAEPQPIEIMGQQFSFVK